MSSRVLKLSAFYFDFDAFFSPLALGETHGSLGSLLNAGVTGLSHYIPFSVSFYSAWAQNQAWLMLGNCCAIKLPPPFHYFVLILYI